MVEDAPRGEPWLAAIDGGGSGSRFVLLAADGQRLNRLDDGPLSLGIGIQAAVARAEAGLDRQAQQIGQAAGWRPPVIALALAGALSNDRCEAFLAHFDHPGSDVLLVHDGLAQLYGAAGGRAASCLAIGTGVVLDWVDESGRAYTAGGWGYPVGDGGSGAWIGRKAVACWLWALDELRHRGRQPDGPMLDALRGQLGTEPTQLIGWSTSNDPARMASLAPAVIEAERQGDALASALLDDGAEALCRLAALAPPHLPLLLAGGLADAYRERLQQRLGAGRIGESRGDAFDGLYRLVCQKMRGTTVLRG